MRGLIVEDAAEMLAVGKHLGPVRQVGAAAIDEIDAGQAVLARDLLRAHMLLHRHRIIGAALDGGVVAHDHAFAALDAADAGDDAGGMDRVLVHAVGGERRQFQKRRARIDQRASRARAAAACRARRGARAISRCRRARPRRARAIKLVAQCAPLRGIGANSFAPVSTRRFNPRQGVLPIPFRRKLWPGFPRKKTPQMTDVLTHLASIWEIFAQFQRERSRCGAFTSSGPPSSAAISQPQHIQGRPERNNAMKKVIADFRRRGTDRGPAFAQGNQLPERASRSAAIRAGQKSRARGSPSARRCRRSSRAHVQLRAETGRRPARGFGTQP